MHNALDLLVALFIMGLVFISLSNWLSSSEHLLGNTIARAWQTIKEAFKARQ